MTTSQNGWPASANKDSLGIKDVTIPGTSIRVPQGVKGGDVETVLMYVASRFNKEVQRLRPGTCWGYDYKKIQGGSSLSNHASGTAIDLNADIHPMGSSGTFTSTQKTAIHKILQDCDDVVRWGGNYAGRKDEMHFEINANAAAVNKLATKINGGSSSKPTGTSIKKGDSGTKVRQIQQFLRDVFPAYKDSVSVKKGELLSVDGDFGDQTEAWVKEFQNRVEIASDGIVGPNTLAKMREFGYTG